LNKQKYLDKIDELIVLANGILGGTEPSSLIYASATTTEFRSSTATFIVSIYGEKSPFYQNFLKSTHDDFASNYDEAKGVLLGIRKHIEQGWLDSVRNQLSAEIFGDYLEMARYLNQEGFYIAAAVIAGTTLEERVMQLCLLHGIAIEALDTRTGAMKPVKADSLNGSLGPYYFDSRNDSKLFIKNYGLRNEAAHGNWNNDLPEKRQIRKDQVDLMIREVEFFIRNNHI